MHSWQLLKGDVACCREGGRRTREVVLRSSLRPAAVEESDAEAVAAAWAADKRACVCVCVCV
jgi:hypothetical protein